MGGDRSRRVDGAGAEVGEGTDESGIWDREFPKSRQDGEDDPVKESWGFPVQRRVRWVCRRLLYRLPVLLPSC